MPDNAPHFSLWLDDFFAAYYRRRPVNATFIGVHDYDQFLPDFSEHTAGDTVAEIQSLLARLQALPPETLSSAQNLDRMLADGYLQTQIWELQSAHFHRGNPSVYTSEAIFGVISLFLNDFAPVEERVNSAIARMQVVPQLLEQGTQNIRQAPLAWTEKAIDECVGAIKFFTVGVDQLISDHKISNANFRRSADGAVAAFGRFQDYLERALSPRANANYACGEDAFRLMLRAGHFINPNLDEMVRYAEEEIAQADAYLAAHATDFGCASSDEALAKLSDYHPTAENYYAAFGQVWQACRAAVEKHQLVTWRDFPIAYVPQPQWARAAAPHLYFLPYRAPAAFKRPPTHNYLMPPLPLESPEKHVRAVNDSVIKLNHVVHHGSIGHHIQNWNAYHAKSRIGQVAACDCASRLAMFCAGTMAEGWAVYATALMDEIGFLTPLESFAEYQSRRRMSARTVVDIRLHRGEFSLDDAAQYYQTRAAMGREMARKEAIKNSMFPGAAVMYLSGSDRIKQLREQVATRMGARFNLRDFHDRFLSFGSIPVELIANEMMKELDHAQ